MNKTGVYIVIAAIILLAGGFIIIKGNKQAVTPSPTPTREMAIPTESPTEKPMPTIKNAPTEAVKPTKAMIKSDAKTFDIDASNFKYSVKEIAVKKGDKIKINLTIKDGMHDLVIDEFDAKTERGNAGETISTEFTADKTGTFEFYCSVGNHRAMGMVGKLIVE